MAGLTPDGTHLFVWLLVLTPITTLVVLMRFWAAWLIKRPFAIDDGLVAFAYVSHVRVSS